MNVTSVTCSEFVVNFSSYSYNLNLILGPLGPRQIDNCMQCKKVRELKVYREGQEGGGGVPCV